MGFLSNLFKKKATPKLDKSDKIIEAYLQEKQTNGNQLTAKDYFAKDIIEKTADIKLVDAIKKTMGATQVESTMVCNDWSDDIKYATISIMIFDYNEDGIMLILGVDGEENEPDEVEIWIGEVNDSDITLTLDKCPKDANAASFIYENTALKVMEFLASRQVL